MATGLSRTVNVEVYLTYEDEGGALITGDSSTMTCNYDTECPEKSDCGGDSAEVKVKLLLCTAIVDTKHHMI